MTAKTKARKSKNGFKTFKKYAIPAAAALATAAAIYASHHQSSGHTNREANIPMKTSTPRSGKHPDHIAHERAMRLRELDRQSDMKKGRKTSIHV